MGCPLQRLFLIYFINIADVQKTGHFPGVAVVQFMGGGTITGGN
jgi:hypothetical protein